MLKGNKISQKVRYRRQERLCEPEGSGYLAEKTRDKMARLIAKKLVEDYREFVTIYSHGLVTIRSKVHQGPLLKNSVQSYM